MEASRADPDGDDIRYRWDFGDGSPSPPSSPRVTPLGIANARSTVLTGQVKHPMNVSFGSESAWWNHSSDAYFDLAVSDGALMIQLSNRTPGRCSWQVPCLGARMTKQ